MAFPGARHLGRRATVPRATRPRRSPRTTPAQQSLGISERELEVLRLLAAGQSNKEIAQRLDVSPNTVKTHVANLFEKLEPSAGAPRRSAGPANWA